MQGAIWTVVILAILLAVTPAQAIVLVPNGNDPGPCLLIVYWDDRVTGCDEVVEGSARDSLLTAAIDNAHVVMKAWRRNDWNLIVPRRAGLADSSNTLREEMMRTTQVDSMAISIASDSIAGDVAILQTHYWLARAVRDRYGSVRRQVERTDYRETWRRAGGRWVLGRFEEVGGSVWKPGKVPKTDPFPSIKGMSMSWADIHERTAVTEARSSCGGDGEYDTAPEVVTSVQPTYPEFAREAQIEGKVVLCASIGRDGRVKNVVVVQGVTGLNDAAMQAVRQWVFKPALDRNGNTVAVSIPVPIDFHF